jgi:single-stranded-DNA-specific exonuclease
MKKWKLRKAISKKADQELSAYPPLVRKLLFYREIKTAEEAEKYLHPDYERDLLDPFLMKDMGKAVERFLLAVEKKEKIIIFGDYDADGVPGSAMLALLLHKIGYHDFEVYIPDRHNEAYGLSPETIEDFAKRGVKLIITIDCGITDVAEVKLANAKGIDVIITDHHLAPAELPPALAIVDAKQLDDNYPEKMLAGSGVMFKFICAVLSKNRFNIPAGWEKWLLDLVVIATVSDMVPLTGENRLLASYGLRVLRQTKRLGLLALLNIIKTRPSNVMEDDISFMLGPRINSASRMSHASQAYYLLTTYDLAEAETIARHLEDKNKERREAVEKVIEGVALQLGENNLPDKLPPIIVAGSEDWGLGMLGLTSSRLVEKYGRSVWLWSKNGHGTIKGSCRTDGSVNLVEVMSAAGGKDFFIDFGGHAMAGGFSLLPEKLPELAPRLISAYEKMEKKAVETELLIDEELKLEQLTWDTYKLIEPMAPFGVGNPKPIFEIKNLAIGEVKYFGNGGLHLELSFQKPDGNLPAGKAGKICAIGFFASPVPDDPSHIFGDVNLAKGERIDLLATLEKSMFKNYPELRLRIVDLKKAE